MRGFLTREEALTGRLLSKEESKARTFDRLFAPIAFLIKWGKSDYNPIDVTVNALDLKSKEPPPDTNDLEFQKRRMREAIAASNYNRGVMEELSVGGGEEFLPRPADKKAVEMVDVARMTVNSDYYDNRPVQIPKRDNGFYTSVDDAQRVMESAFGSVSKEDFYNRNS